MGTQRGPEVGISATNGALHSLSEFARVSMPELAVGNTALDMSWFIKLSPEERNCLIQLHNSNKGDDRHVLSGRDVTLQPALRRPVHIYCVEGNYGTALRSTGSKPEVITFPKSPSTVIGPGKAIRLHSDVTNSVDYEAELAIIMLRHPESDDEQEIRDSVFGLTWLNDVTARDVLRRPQKWLSGKSLATFCPMSCELILSTDDMWPIRGSIKTFVNNELRQSFRVEDMLVDPIDLIRNLKKRIEFDCGDVIATGSGTGRVVDSSDHRYLRVGDVVSIDYGGAFTLSNPCV